MADVVLSQASRCSASSCATGRAMRGARPDPCPACVVQRACVLALFRIQATSDACRHAGRGRCSASSLPALRVFEHARAAGGLGISVRGSGDQQVAFRGADCSQPVARDRWACACGLACGSGRATPSSAIALPVRMGKRNRAWRIVITPWQRGGVVGRQPHIQVGFSSRVSYVVAASVGVVTATVAGAGVARAPASRSRAPPIATARRWAGEAAADGRAAWVAGSAARRRCTNCARTRATNESSDATCAERIAASKRHRGQCRSRACSSEILHLRLQGFAARNRCVLTEPSLHPMTRAVVATSSCSSTRSVNASALPAGKASTPTRSARTPRAFVLARRIVVRIRRRGSVQPNLPRVFPRRLRSSPRRRNVRRRCVSMCAAQISRTTRPFRRGRPDSRHLHIASLPRRARLPDAAGRFGEAEGARGDAVDEFLEGRASPRARPSSVSGPGGERPRGGRLLVDIVVTRWSIAPVMGWRSQRRSKRWPRRSQRSSATSPRRSGGVRRVSPRRSGGWQSLVAVRIGEAGALVVAGFDAGAAAVQALVDASRGDPCGFRRGRRDRGAAEPSSRGRG